MTQSERFDHLPVISDSVRERILEEMDEFNKLTPEARTERLEDDLADLRRLNEELANAVDGLTEGPLSQDYVSDKLTHTEWLWLRNNMRFAYLMLLRAMNEARKEQTG